MDYIFRWLGAKFLGPEYAVTEAGETPTLRPTEPDPQEKLPFAAVSADAPLCAECGSIMTRNGSCYKCGNCGGTSGGSYGSFQPGGVFTGKRKIAPFIFLYLRFLHPSPPVFSRFLSFSSNFFFT